MKFLCVPCDSPMKLQTVAPPDRGSLSIVYTCPECGYEIAMLTNAYETQVVQSLGVRIGPAADPAASITPGAACPFAAMIPSAPYEPSRDLEPANERERVTHATGAAPATLREPQGRPEPSRRASDRVGGAGGAKPPG